MFAGEVLRWRIDWLPQLALALGFRIDGWAWLFALLILGIGALIVLYAAYCLHHEDPPARLFLSLMLFMGAMLAIVLADNLLLRLVFWELTRVSSFLPVGACPAIFQHDLEGLLAHSTVSRLALITPLSGPNAPLVVVPGVFHIPITHANWAAPTIAGATMFRASTRRSPDRPPVDETACPDRAAQPACRCRPADAPAGRVRPGSRFLPARPFPLT